MSALPDATAYGGVRPDAVRSRLESGFFAQLISRLLAEVGGGAMLDLGCGDRQSAKLAGARLDRYLGVDLQAPHPPPHASIRHDLREGLGPVGARPFDLYLASFGVASHLAPPALRRLLREIRAHARPGSLVALEALGLHSLEWPGLWDTRPGAERLLPYRLGSDVRVHPWAPLELAALAEDAGLMPVEVLDRTLQAGPKAGEGRYWSQLPPVRVALNRLLDGDAGGAEVLGAPLPPLPAHRAALVHHALAGRRRRLIEQVYCPEPSALAREVWALEQGSAGGYGHGLVLVARTR